MDPLVEHLAAMGFEHAAARDALVSTEGNLERAVNVLLTQPPSPPALVEVEPEAAPEPDTLSEDSTQWNADWDDLLAELTEMGFDDEIANRTVLAEANGDVKDAVKELVSRERMHRQL